MKDLLEIQIFFLCVFVSMLKKRITPLDSVQQNDMIKNHTKQLYKMRQHVKNYITDYGVT